MSRILISYRREDTAGHAGRLYDLLVERFGPDRIFMDVDTISPGDDFVEVIRSAVTSSDVLIALIGREWVTVQHPSGHRRLDDPDDFVALELGTALEHGIRVVPVLVQGATMPGPQDLPPRLRPLARRNAVEISDTRFRRDAGALIDSLERILEGRAPHHWLHHLPKAGVVILALAALAAGGVGYRMWTRLVPAPESGAGERAPSGAPDAIRETGATTGAPADGAHQVAAPPEPAPAPPTAATTAQPPAREPAHTERPHKIAAPPAAPSRVPPISAVSPRAGGAGVAAPAASSARHETTPEPVAPPRRPPPSSAATGSPPAAVASLPPPTAPRLTAPGPGASLPQATTRAWTFRWQAPASGGHVERYHLVVQGPGASWPAADITTSDTAWTMPARGECSYVPDRTRTGWLWKVRAQREGGSWSEWSTGHFDVDPVDRDTYCRGCPAATICAR